MDLTDLLKRNHNLFNRMKKLASKQKRLLEGDNIYEFLDISSQRRRIQQEISSNESRYNKLETEGMALGSKEEVRQLTSEIEDMLLSIQQADKGTGELLENRKDDLSSEIKGFRMGQKAVKGYGGFNVKSPRFINRQG